MKLFEVVSSTTPFTSPTEICTLILSLPARRKYIRPSRAFPGFRRGKCSPQHTSASRNVASWHRAGNCGGVPKPRQKRQQRATTSGYFSWRLLLRCGDYVCPLICAETRQRGPLSAPPRRRSGVGLWVFGSRADPVRPIIYHDVSRTFFVLPSTVHTLLLLFTDVIQVSSVVFNFSTGFSYARHVRRANRESFSIIVELFFFFYNNLRR